VVLGWFFFLVSGGVLVGFGVFLFLGLFLARPSWDLQSFSGLGYVGRLDGGLARLRLSPIYLPTPPAHFFCLSSSVQL